MTSIQALTRLMLLVYAPFLGILIFQLSFQPVMKAADFTSSQQVDFTMPLQTEAVLQKLNNASKDGSLIKKTIEKIYTQYTQTNNTVTSLLNLAKAQVNRPPQIFDNRVSRVLGKPIRQVSSANICLLYTSP